MSKSAARLPSASTGCTPVADFTPNIALALAAAVVFGLLILAIITMTSFVKISVVLFLLRNALGVQQAPPNVVLYSIALILTVFISMPLGRQVHDVVAPELLSRREHSITAWQSVAERAAEPVRAHLVQFSTKKERSFFLQAAGRLWTEGMQPETADDDLSVLIPSFLVGELKRAFETGFLLYLPFVVIDLVITTILIAMGMSQVQPTTIAVPLKLLLFVLVEGWTRLLHSLVLSYVV